MKTAFIKFLPIAAAVLLATSCSKDDNDNAPATQSGRGGVETVTANTIPFTIRVNTGHSLKKVGYAESTNEEEKGWYNISFSDDDVDKLKMKIYIGEITNESNLLTTLTLKNATTGEFTGTVGKPAVDADLTAVITTDGNSLVTSSDKSLQDLLATCAHTFLGTFKYGAAEVTLTDQNAYLDITYRESDKIDINSSEITVTDSRVWVAVPAKSAVTSQALGISKAADEVKPGTIYTVVRNFTPKAFSVSSTKKVYFSRGNLQYNPKQDKWQFAAHQYDICIKADNNDVSSMYNKDYDGWIDLFGWGTWLNGENLLKPYETQKDAPAKYIWSGNSAIDENWTTLSKDEWIYLLGEYWHETPCRDKAKTLRATMEVNGVFGLVILPDGSNIANDSWETLESAGAVFLPAAGGRVGAGVYSVGGDGFYWSS
ncbi:MAG: hypothetical protein IKB95_03085, partial [Bacteroidales bacterium]|nr:hypothetical protein [Bacteroidales bacterium]